MAELIRAGCPDCGHSIRVPASLGGKKARCPQCGGLISIPAIEDAPNFLKDADLPQVAAAGDPPPGAPPTTRRHHPPSKQLTHRRHVPAPAPRANLTLIFVVIGAIALIALVFLLMGKK